ncbi:uncharacterized protein F5891DRAFT_973996 [Suillus fuscotomentosus]|uniref:HCP-like protein n=1 Tax=Suillus fuscotomentosus TaxID=1912939 RepID=A0AAD4HSM7_9AGAM|nr:uncharacterized protein F5891DRAFT_973996 [Suillus fuscotomentosus]KAG1908640.1 hypothetical protein F5891DRAFT_973996 [Suillus fuscotomentosus]
MAVSHENQVVQRKEREARKQATAINPSLPVPSSSRSTRFPASSQVQDLHAISPPRPYYGTSPRVPESPLLHSQFRNSTASNADYLNRKSFLSLTDEPNGYYDELESYYEENSMYSLRQSHTPGASTDSHRAWHTTLEPTSGSTDVLNIQSSIHDMHLSNSSTPVPTVVVSKPQDVDKQVATNEPKLGGKSPIVDPTPRINFSRPGRPPIISSEEQKRQVLERNSRRTRSPLTAHTPLSFVPITPQTGGPIFNQTMLFLPRPSHPPLMYTTPLTPRLDGSPSPTGNSNFPTQSSSSPGNRSPSTEPSTPQEYLQLGIQYHEANKLQDSAFYFEKSAKEQGGCGTGMLLWGLTLRHGWGCEKNEKSGFKWLTKAAESAVDDLGKAREGMDVKAVRSELVLAIYEVGQCFFHGWGVAKDYKMAVSYYRVAANLGDGDAQEDLAFCLANGKGCKKDKKKAAKWYRAAVAQGASDVGMAWIYKDKYKG